MSGPALACELNINKTNILLRKQRQINAAGQEHFVDCERASKLSSDGEALARIELALPLAPCFKFPKPLKFNGFDITDHGMGPVVAEQRTAYVLITGSHALTCIHTHQKSSSVANPEVKLNEVDTALSCSRIYTVPTRLLLNILRPKIFKGPRW